MGEGWRPSSSCVGKLRRNPPQDREFEVGEEPLVACQEVLFKLSANDQRQIY